MDIKTQIKEILQQKNRKLSENSMKTYVSLLTSLYNKMNGEDIKFFIKKHVEIMEYINNLKSDASKKTILSAYYILTGLEPARKLMVEIAQKVNKKYSENTKSEKEKNNWLSQEKVDEIILSRKTKVIALMNKKKIDMHEIFEIRDFLCVYLFFVVPPRRSRDYVFMKLKYTKNVNNIEYNFYDPKQKAFIFNNFKTDKYRGQDIVKITNNDELIFFEKLLKFWYKYNKTEFMIFNNDYKQLDGSGLTRILNKIFDAKISVNMLRHIKITDIYDNTSKSTVRDIIENLEKLSNDMGHSMATQKKYYKK